MTDVGQRDNVRGRVWERRFRMLAHLIQRGRTDRGELGRVAGTHGLQLEHDLRILGSTGCVRVTLDGVIQLSDDILLGIKERVTQRAGTYERRLETLGYVMAVGLASESDITKRTGAHGNQLYLDLQGLADATGHVHVLPERAGAVFVPLLQWKGLKQRLGENPEIKWRVAGRALDLVEDGETILIGPGATCFFLAIQAALKKPNLCVLTNSLGVHQFLTSRVREVHVIGGIVSKRGLDTYPSDLGKCIEITRRKVDKVFLGIEGWSVNPELGIRCSQVDCERQRQAVFRTPGTAVVLANHCKLDIGTGGRFTTFQELDERGKKYLVITDKYEPPTGEEQSRLQPAKDLLGDRLVEAD